MTVIDQYMAYVAPLKGSMRYARWSVITAIAALLERRLWLDRGRFGPIFPNLYTILVGRAATGKSFAGEQATNLLTDLLYPINSTPLRIGPTKITQAALYQELKDATRTLQLPGQPAYQQCPLFIFASELAVNMVDFGGGLLTNELIDFYDSKSLTAITVKRIVSADKPTILHNPSLTLLGCSTEGFLQQAAKDKLITSGLASRIIFVVEPERIEKEYDYIELDPAARNAIQGELMRIFAMKGPLRFDEPAQRYFTDMARTADAKCFNENSEFLQNYYGRKHAHIAKVAMILAVAANRYTVLEADLLQASILLAEIEPDMLKSFGMRAIDKDESAVSYILPLIPKAPACITKNDMLTKLAENGMFMPISETNGVLRTIIAGLKAAGLIKVMIAGNEEIFSRLK